IRRRSRWAGARGGELGKGVVGAPAVAGVALTVAAWTPRRRPPEERRSRKRTRCEAPLGARGCRRAACVQVAGRSESWAADAWDAGVSGDGASSSVTVLGGRSGERRKEPEGVRICANLELRDPYRALSAGVASSRSHF